MTPAPSNLHHALRGSAAGRGLTIIECLLAIVVLAIVGVAMVDVLSAGQRRVAYAGEAIRGVSVAEDLLEEIAAKPYAGTGALRTQWCVSDYSSYADGPNSMTDCLGTIYPADNHGFSRATTVSSSSVGFAGLDGFTTAGKVVAVQVEGPDGVQLTLSRFIAEPLFP